MNLNNKFYNNAIVNKPWGYEYMVYTNKNNIGLTFLKINHGHKTSLHCHPTKKTGFIILDGVAEVQIGIYKKNTKKFKPLSRLVFRPGLFHSIKAISKKGLYALEIERPYIKKDLVRLKDSYGRKLKDYEGKKYIENLNSKLIKFKLPRNNNKNIYRFNDKQIIIEKTKNLSHFSSRDGNSSLAILDGHIVDSKGRKVISYGEIIKRSTLKILSNFFKIRKPLIIMSIIKNKKKRKKDYILKNES